MNARTIVPGLILINLALVAALAFLLTREPGTQPLVQTVLQTNTLTRVAVRKINSTNFWATAPQFHWSSLESTNYQEYILKLRAVGCPDETIRDIVIADIAKHFAQHRATLRSPTRRSEFWKPTPSESRNMRSALRSLNAEQRNLVRQLLGTDLEQELVKFSSEPAAGEIDLAFIAAGKTPQVAAILSRYKMMEQDLHESSAGFWSAQDDRELEELERRQLDELREILSPQEFEEYELRQSRLSDDLRAELEGMEPTEEEFRKLFRLRKEEQAASAGRSDPGEEEDADFADAKASEARELRMREALGEERFNQYVRSQNSDYRALHNLAERFNIGQDTVNQAFDFISLGQEQAQQLLEDGSLDPERREQALAEIAEESARTLRNLLGAEVYPYVRGSIGGSLFQFAR
ncbi:MAG: hypothetical protein FJ405_06355 [Verrucomicrobia bacterium]|nr:hypothetical protein [Verrucomicrobiota bacterium]